MKPHALILFLFTAWPAMAECPQFGADRKLRLAALYGELKKTESVGEAQMVADQIWRVWRSAPDAKSQRLLDDGVRRIRYGDYALAKTILTKLIDYCPAYAEGWNQRAFARFLDGDLEGSLTDLDAALEREPWHFAALAGKGLTLLRQGREGLAHKALREALVLHPWLKERRFLPKDQKI